MAPTVLLEVTEKKVLKRSFAMMGKSQKFSKALSSSFVPDYRHAAETMGESEGFGSSGRVDSEDSCAPKRKCISLNKDRGDCFNVPLQVISFAKMSGSERKEIELRLKAELERIQMLQKKFLSINAATVSSSSNGFGKKGGSNAPHLKRGSSGRFESTKQRPLPQTAGGNSYAAIMKQCESILNKLRTHQFGWVFNNPVDAVALKIPDYYTVIKHPMDLGTIKNKLSSGAYSSPLGFVADVRLTFTNAMTYNPPGNDVHVMADKLSKFFESKWKPIEKKLATADLFDRREADAPKPVSQPKKRKISPVACKTIPDKVIPRVTAEERQLLSNRLQSMLEDMPDQIVDFLRRHISSANESSEEEIEVDIDVLSDDVLLELKKLLDECLLEKPIGQHAKTEPSEIEILNESGLSNSSMHPCKGNEPVDEDVDIGGNDPPMSSYPPVEIEKDAPHRDSKCSSSSSSSSDSGSSSSGPLLFSCFLVDAYLMLPHHRIAQFSIKNHIIVSYFCFIELIHPSGIAGHQFVYVLSQMKFKLSVTSASAYLDFLNKKKMLIDHVALILLFCFLPYSSYWPSLYVIFFSS